MASKILRSSDLIPPDVKFPVVQKFSTRLPTYGEVIGVLRQIMEDNTKNVPIAEALVNVANMIYSKYHHDTVYCLTVQGIRWRIEKDWDIFKKGKRRLSSGRKSGKEIDNYKNLADKSDKLYDVPASDKDRKTQCAVEWGVTMGAKELEYLEDQGTSRLQECDNQVDPVWWSANQRKLKESERMEAWKASKGEQFSCADDTDMQDSGEEGSSGLKHPDDSPDEYLPECESDGRDDEAKTVGSSKKRRKSFDYLR